ncbi:MAG TPA: hypothetical protein VKW76_02340 [Candidatus Binatia bacterium]|nr:hypothetical protein [Candidatus Binatia bacterium]
MRSVMAGVLVGALVFGGAAAARAHQGTPGQEVGYSLLATGANVLYVPAKLVVAGTGLVVGSVAGLLTGGDVRAAYAVWVPTAGGDFVLRPEHMAGTRNIEFFGSDYADTPSTASEEGSAGRTYRAGYMVR